MHCRYFVLIVVKSACGRRDRGPHAERGSSQYAYTEIRSAGASQRLSRIRTLHGTR
jgi:hypothetical protein